MSKKPRVRTLMDGQHVKGSKTLLKSSSGVGLSDLHIKLKELQFEKLYLVVSEILGLFINVLTTKR